MNPFQSLREYEIFVYTLSQRFPSILHSTLIVIRRGRLLAELTDPHHKHVPPDIKHHRILAPEMSFTRPNLSVLVQEIEET